MFIDHLFSSFQYSPLNKEERDDLSKRVVERKLRKRQYILQENDVCKHYTFIAEGCLRRYYVDKKGAEHNLQFTDGREWITDIGSFYSGNPSKVNIEAMEPSVIFQISRKDLFYLFRHNPKYDRNFRVIIENRYVELEKRVSQAYNATVKERYLSFIGDYPHLSGKLHYSQIASYLGVTPEFLSKIRKEISDGQK